MTRAAHSFCITGTDTGAGKTLVACALLRALRIRGVDVGAMKPVETGVDSRGPLDAQALRAAAGNVDPLDDICPQRFRLAAAPTVAAEAEGSKVDLHAIEAAYARLNARHERLVVEGAGGLLAPIAEGVTIADLAARFKLALVVVTRARLGTINHTRLTLEAARRRELDVAGVVISHADGTLSDTDESNLVALREELGALLIGEIPPLATGALPENALLNIDALLERADGFDE